MNATPTMNRYLARTYLTNLMLMTAALLGVIYLFDTIELLRRASKAENAPLPLILEMGLLKLPDNGQTAFPFAILFSAMFTFWKLSLRQELVVARASGFSAWQFLAPAVAVAMAASCLNLALVNPAGSLFLTRYQALETERLSPRKSTVALLREGLWLRQGVDGGYVILHAGRVGLPDWALKNVVVFYFDDNNDFLRRIDAPSARIEDGFWIFEQKPGAAASPAGRPEKLPTDLTVREIEDSFNTPESLSFWALPGFIRTMEATGFDSTRLRIHFHALLSQPLLFAAMILLAACVSLRPPRFRGGFTVMAAGIVTGFFVFFMSSFLQALGASHQIPVVLAAWAPALITLLLGIATMLVLEDG